MALSIRSKTFQDTYDELDAIAKNITSKEELEEFLNSKGTDLLEFKSAVAEYKAEVARGEEDFRGRGTTIGRTLGRAAGETVSGLIDFADAVLPEEITDVFSEAADNIGEELPDELKQLAGEIFDPYHGEGLVAGGEEMVGTLGSYLIPYTGTMKIFNAARAGINLGRTSSSRALLRRQLKNLDKSSRTKFVEEVRKKKKREEFIKGSTMKGTAFATAQTIVEDPLDNSVNLVIESFPESEEYLKRLAVDPNDSIAKQYLQAYINNLGLTAIVGGPLALTAAYKAPIMAGVKTGASKIPGIEAAKNSKLVDSISRNFSSRLGTGDDELLGALVRVNRGGEAGIIRAEGTASDLSKVVKDEYGKDPKIVTTINNALEGDKAALSSLKPETKKLVSQMRSDIDNLSKETTSILKDKDGKKKSTLKATIEGNLGVYVTKSYDFYDDPIVKKRITKDFEKFMDNGSDPDNKFSVAIQGIMESKGVDADEAKALLSKLIKGRTVQQQFDSLSGLITSSNKISTVKAGLKREDLPDGVSALLGEVKDPYKNYVKTMGTLSRLKAEKDFLEDVAKNLARKEVLGKSSQRVSGKNIISLDDIGAERLSRVFGRTPVTTKQVVNPLEGIFVDENYARAIREGLNSVDPTSPTMRYFMTAKGASQTAKTALSPVTHGRNIMGNGFLMIANGFGGPKGFGTALQSTASKLRNASNKELGERMAEYVELGVSGSGVNIGVIRRNLDAFANNPDRALKTTLDRGNNLPKNLITKTLDIYQAEDDLFKIAHFEKTLSYIKKSKKYKNLSLKEQKNIAAQRTRDLMPNYNLVPRFFKDLRVGVLSDFLSFPAEMVRVSKNLAKYSLQDIASGDAVLQAQGARRLAGFTSVGIAGDMLSDYSADMMGLTSNQQDAINDLGPSWEYNTNKIYLSGINRDKNGHLGVDYLNLGPIDPFSYLKQAAKGTHTLLAAGFGDDEYSDAELEKIALGTLDNAVGPFLSPAMITEALMDLAGAEGRRGFFGAAAAGDVERLKEVISPAIDVIKPGFVDLVLRRMEYEKSLAKYSPLGGEAKKKSGATFVEEEVDIPAALGWKRQRIDLTAGTNFALKPALARINKAGDEFERILNRNPNLDETDTEYLFDRFKFAQRDRVKGFQQLRSVLENYQDLYGSSFYQELQRGRSDRGAVKTNRKDDALFSAALQNIFIPYALRETDTSRLLTLPPLDRERYYNLYRKLNGVRFMN